MLVSADVYSRNKLEFPDTKESIVMAKKSKIVGASGEELKTRCPKMAAVHPFGSLVMIELLGADDLNDTSLHLPDNTVVDDGAPQAYIVELGPKVSEESGLEIGQRIYWQGNCIPVNDPRSSRVRGLLEMHQIKGLIEEEK